jgi:hypothetical protein
MGGACVAGEDEGSFDFAISSARFHAALLPAHINHIRQV